MQTDHPIFLSSIEIASSWRIIDSGRTPMLPNPGYFTTRIISKESVYTSIAQVIKLERKYRRIKM
jgi:hypothetical protein